MAYGLGIRRSILLSYGVETLFHTLSRSNRNSDVAVQVCRKGMQKEHQTQNLTLTLAYTLRPRLSCRMRGRCASQALELSHSSMSTCRYTKLFPPWGQGLGYFPV